MNKRYLYTSLQILSVVFLFVLSKIINITPQKYQLIVFIVGFTLFFAVLMWAERKKKIVSVITPKETKVDNNKRSFEQAVKDNYDSIKRTAREKVSLSARFPTSPLPLWTSKFGGQPYLPKTDNYPLFEGKPMLLLAQLNFEEIPNIPNYPEKGILQFFVSPIFVADWQFDKNSWIEKKYYHVRWYPHVTDKTELLQKELPLNEYIKSPLKEFEFALDFYPGIDHVSISDYRVEEYTDQHFLSDINFKTERLSREYHLFMDGSGHKLGGYLARMQYDNRSKEKYGDYELLLQIDSQYNDNTKRWQIIWGDSGVGNFFIKPEDLKNRNFSDVLFTWDCG